MKKLVIWIAFVGVVAYSPAPRLDPPKGAKFEPEQSQAQRASQQGVVKVIGEVGIVEADTTPNEISSVQSESTAVRNIVSGPTESNEENPATQNLVAAEQDIQKQSGAPARTVSLAAILIALGFGIILAVRQWANKNVPYTPVSNKRRF